MNDTPLRLGIAGYFMLGSGYPNATFLLRALEKENGVALLWISKGVHAEQSLANQYRYGWLSRCLMILRILAVSVHGAVAGLMAWRQGKLDVLYLPYPAIGTLLVFSLLPARWRPPLLADCFISIYDTICIDRGLLRPDSIAGRILWHLERKALATANCITVDTDLNRQYLADLFRLDPGKVASIPLATDEDTYRYTPYHGPAADGVLRVLFIGTFSPLHGIDTICEAARLLSDRSDIRFTLIGTGQDAPLAHRILGESPRNVRWIQEWLSPEELHRQVAASDVCLGIFGKTHKAARVWPYKNYIAMMVGRVVISQSTTASVGGFRCDDTMYAVPAGNPAELSLLIEKLSDSPDAMIENARDVRLLYERHLSNSSALALLRNIAESMKQHVSQ